MKSSLYAVLALMSLALIAPAFAQADVCEDEFLAVNPHEEDCHRFFLCMMFERVDFTCDPGHIFSREDLSCIRGNWDTCLPAPPGPWLPPDVCEDEFFTVNDHPDTCGMFFLCLGGEAVVFTCEEGTIFSREERDCIPGNVDTCVFN